MSKFSLPKISVPTDTSNPSFRPDIASPLSINSNSETSQFDRLFRHLAPSPSNPLSTTGNQGDAHETKANDDNIVASLTDYDKDHYRTSLFSSGGDFWQFFNGLSRPKWSKVRLIVFRQKVEWEILRELGIHFNLHPIALDDTLELWGMGRKNFKNRYSSNDPNALNKKKNRSKLEFFNESLFINCQVRAIKDSYKIQEEQEKRQKRMEMLKKNKKSWWGSKPVQSSGIKKNSSESGFDTDGKPSLDAESESSDSSSEDELEMDPKQILKAARSSTFAVNHSTLQRLTHDYRIHLSSNQVHLYLTRDSTLLMFFANPPPPSFINHLLKPLSEQTSLLRMTADPSMLLQSVLERIAEDVRDIVEQVEKQITLLESRILLEKPELNQVKHMRVLSSEILMIKEHLLPLDSVVQSLISHETHEMNCFDRHARHQIHSNTLLVEPTHGFHFPPPVFQEQPPFLITKQSEIYLKNLSNQIKELEDSLELFDALTGGLIAFIFNLINFSSSKSSANLALITVIFLPLGFVTGYFGMNFHDFDGVVNTGNSVSLFWKIACPFLVFFVALFSGYRIVESIQSTRRKLQRWKLQRQADKKQIAF